MTRLTKSEVAIHKARLTDWLEPNKMKRHVENVNEQMGSRDLFNQPGVEFLRDAWLAAEFAVMRRAKYVRLIADEWPDFELQLNAQVERFECVEADVPGRRRGDEYRAAASLTSPEGIFVEEDPIEDWIERADKVPQILQTAIKKKIGKGYPNTAQLVIYLNIDEFGIRQREIEASFRRSTEKARGKFVAVWILWKGKTYGPMHHKPMPEVRPCSATP